LKRIETRFSLVESAAWLPRLLSYHSIHVVFQVVLIPQPHLYSHRRLGGSRVVVNFTLEVSSVRFHGCLEGGEADAGKKEALQASDSMRCGAP